MRLATRSNACKAKRLDIQSREKGFRVALEDLPKKVPSTILCRSLPRYIPPPPILRTRHGLSVEAATRAPPNSLCLCQRHIQQGRSRQHLQAGRPPAMSLTKSPVSPTARRTSAVPLETQTREYVAPSSLSPVVYLSAATTRCRAGCVGAIWGQRVKKKKKPRKAGCSIKSEPCSRRLVLEIPRFF